MKTALQIDFDGTVTVEDISFLLLDTYADNRWRDALAEYTKGKISVGAFNRRVFGMVKADRQTMLKMIMSSEKLRVRPGMNELADYCSQQGYKTVIVSNGLTFYIEAILKNLGIDDIEVHASENEFSPDGMRVKYLGPDGDELETGFKEAYTTRLLKEEYHVVYIGDGTSDIASARMAGKVFATGDLLQKCSDEKLDCTAFSDFFDVIRGLESWSPG